MGVRAAPSASKYFAPRETLEELRGESEGMATELPQVAVLERPPSHRPEVHKNLHFSGVTLYMRQVQRFPQGSCPEDRFKEPRRGIAKKKTPKPNNKPASTLLSCLVIS